MQTPDVAIKTAPISVRPNPKNADFDNFSFRIKGESRAIHIGPVQTNTTELATDVYSREEIQHAKCIAKKIPERKPSANSCRVRAFKSERWYFHVNGAKAMLAKNNRKAAIVKEGASSCANLIKIDAVETARIPIKRIAG